MLALLAGRTTLLKRVPDCFVRQKVLEVPSEEGFRFMELVRGQEVKAMAKGKKALLYFCIEPRQVLCIAAPSAPGKTNNRQRSASI